VSERGGGGNIPGATRRIPGIPSDAQFFDLSGFTTLNAQRPRPAIGDQEMAWCKNMMPIGPNYVRSLPDNGPPIYTVPAPPYFPPAVEFTNSTPPAPPIVVGTQAVHALGPFSISTNPIDVPDAGDWVVVMIMSMNTQLTSAAGPALIHTPTSPNLIFTQVFANYPGLGGGLLPDIASSAPPNYASASVFYAPAPMPLVGEVINSVMDGPTGTTTAIMVTAVVKGAYSFDSNMFSIASDFSGAQTTVSTGSLNTTVPNALLMSFFTLWANNTAVAVPELPWSLGATDTASQVFDGIGNQGGFDYYSVTTLQSSTGWPLYPLQPNWFTVTFSLTGSP
jgi:hypothetical protein